LKKAETRGIDDANTLLNSGYPGNYDYPLSGCGGGPQGCAAGPIALAGGHLSGAASRIFC